MAQRDPAAHAVPFHSLEYVKICSSTEITIDCACDYYDPNLRIGKRCGDCLTHFLYHLSIKGVDRRTIELDPGDAGDDAQTYEFQAISHAKLPPCTTQREKPNVRGALDNWSISAVVASRRVLPI